MTHENKEWHSSFFFVKFSLDRQSVSLARNGKAGLVHKHSSKNGALAVEAEHMVRPLRDASW